MTPPTDHQSASSGVLDPPPDGGNGRSLPNAHQAAPDDHVWHDLVVPDQPDPGHPEPGRPIAAASPIAGGTDPGGTGSTGSTGTGSTDPGSTGAGSTDPGPGREGTAAPARRHGAHSARALRKTRFAYPKRRWPRRILIASNVMVGVILLSAASAYGYFDWRINQIKRVVLPSLVGGAHPATKAAAVPVAPPGAPMTILVVGSDSRAGDTGEDAAQFGNTADVGGQRSDTIMLVHIVPATTSATILSIPRDLWVQIPGMGSSRINSAFNNGADLLVQTIEKDLGIPIDHYVEVDFQSFRDIVNAVGGVQEYFPTPAKDQYSNLNIPAAGCYNMTGVMALAFARSRHYEYKVNGRWVYEAESDLARIQRQQSFVKKMIAKAEGEGLNNPIELNGIIGGITSNLTIDSGFSENLLLTLADRYRNISPGSLPTSTLPTTAAVIGGADVLLLQQPQAQQAIATFLNPPPTASSSTSPTTAPATAPSVAPSSASVVVLNGSGRTGEAAAAGAALSRQGFVVTSVGSATNYSYTSPEVLYLPGDQAQAQLLASAVEGGAQLQAVASLPGSANVELITGQSYRGITTATVGGTSTATTVPATTTTTQYELPGAPPGFVAPASCSN